MSNSYNARRKEIKRWNAATADAFPLVKDRDNTGNIAYLEKDVLAGKKHPRVCRIEDTSEPKSVVAQIRKALLEFHRETGLPEEEKKLPHTINYFAIKIIKERKGFKRVKLAMRDMLAKFNEEKNGEAENLMQLDNLSEVECIDSTAGEPTEERLPE